MNIHRLISKRGVKTSFHVIAIASLILGQFGYLVPNIARANGIGSIDTECQDFGFDYGIVKWEYEDEGWVVEDDGDPLGTDVSGSSDSADWDAGDSGAAGFVYKGGNIKNENGYHDAYVFGENETSGTFDKPDGKADISHITFCGNDGQGGEEPNPITIVAHKIVCTDEAELPNWGAADGPDITGSTAQDWVDEHDSCSFVSGWEFEYAPDGTPNPGDDLYGYAGGDWTTFPTSTNEFGEAVFYLDEDSVENGRLWLREVLQDGYIPFTYYVNGKSNVDDYTAEFYCHNDSLNYDNYEWLNNPETGETYNCVAWNVPEAPVCGNDVKEEGEQCDGDDGVTQGYTCNDSCELKQIPVCTEGTLWMIGDEEASQLDNPVDELNWPGEFGNFPDFPNPFEIGVNTDDEFPWNSNGVKNYATDVDVDFNFNSDENAQATLTVSWSPGKSAAEQKEVLLDDVSLGTTPVRVGTSVAGWWNNMEIFQDTFTFELTPGNHTLTFLHPDGDGTLWDYVKLEIDRCGDPTNTICVTKFNDLNENGEADNEEPTLPGWDVQLTKHENHPAVCQEGLTKVFAAVAGIFSLDLNNDNEDCQTPSDPVMDSGTTGENGTYCFEVSENGMYEVTESMEEGWHGIVESCDVEVNLDDETQTYYCDLFNAEDAQCEEGPAWAFETIDYEQGTLKNGSPVTDSSRTDATAVLGEPDGNFFSLGDGGWLTAKFIGPVLDEDGNDLSFHEVTFGRNSYPVETLSVEVSQDGSNWLYAGDVTNKDGGDGVGYVDFSSTGLDWIQYVRVSDATDYDLHNNSADGYDLDAIDATYQVCEEPTPEGQICGFKWHDEDEDRFWDAEESKLADWGMTLWNATELETVAVDSANSAGDDSSNTLNSGTFYKIEVTGTWLNGSTRAVDAEFISDNNWLNHQDGPAIGPNQLDLQVNNAFVNWGANVNTVDGYTSDHTYFLVMEGTDAPVNLRIFDGAPDTNTINEGWYNDNTGSLEVKIYELSVTDEADTTKDGSYCFEDLPEGHYVVSEEVKDNWTNVTPAFLQYWLEEGESVDNANFGNTRTAPEREDGTITVCKYEDVDDSGDLDKEIDNLLSGWTVSLGDNSNQIENWGFEAPNVMDTSPKGWEIYESGTSGLAWIVEWITNTPSYNGLSKPEKGWLELHNPAGTAINWDPQEGNQYAELDSDWDGPNGSKSGEPASTLIYQNVENLIPGQEYNLSFWHSPRPNTNKDNNVLKVYWGDTMVKLINDADGTTNNNTVWKKYLISDLVATSDTMKLSFEDAGTNDSLGNFLDNVSLTGPEKTTTEECVVFENLPFGDYTVYEELQNGWTQVLPVEETGKEYFEVTLSVENPDEFVDFLNKQIPDEVDVCPNIEGNQTEVPAGKYIDNEGNCVDNPTGGPDDVCPNIEGIQEEVPEGLILDEGQCVEPEEPTDVCPNLEGDQSEVPQGYELVDEQCVEIEEPYDVCPNIDGDQESVPDGFYIDNEGNCVEESTPTVTTSTGGGGGGGGGIPALNVFNEATETVDVPNATISFFTNIKATCRIGYGKVSKDGIDLTDPNFGYEYSVNADQTNSTYHTATLTNIEQGETYYWRPNCVSGGLQDAGIQLAFATDVPQVTQEDVTVLGFEFLPETGGSLADYYAMVTMIFAIIMTALFISRKGHELN